MRPPGALEWLTVGVLFAATTFSYLHANYTTAVICGVCAGFCLGIACARRFAGRW